MTIALMSLCLTACASSYTGKITKETKNHMINVAEDGNVYPATPGTYTYLIDELDDQKLLNSLSQEYDNHINEIINGIKVHQWKGKKKKIMIFIHGGLNTSEGSLHRVERDFKKILNDDIYPVFINWRSGGLSSYGAHLTKIRDGEETDWAFATAPIYLISDFLSGIAIAPVAWLEQGELSYRDSALREDEKLCEFDPNNFLGNIDCPGSVDRSWFEAIGSSVYWWATAAPKLITTPFTYSFGKPSWDVMNRRARTMLFKTCEFTHDCRLDKSVSLETPSYLKYYQDHLKNGDLQNSCMARLTYEKTLISGTNQANRFEYEMCSGALSVFLQKLAVSLCRKDFGITEPCSLGDYEISLVGHSMGAIVIGEVLKNHAYIPFQNIVFMGGAIRGIDAIQSLGGYMNQHKKTKFYNLSLHPKNEDLESSYGVLPSGSLLVWIDTMYGLPETEFDLMFGRWKNARKQVAEFTPGVACRMHFKVFGFNEKIEPQQHGEFDEFEYWDKAFWFDSNKSKAISKICKAFKN